MKRNLNDLRITMHSYIIPLKKRSNISLIPSVSVPSKAAY